MTRSSGWRAIPRACGVLAALALGIIPLIPTLSGVAATHSAARAGGPSGTLNLVIEYEQGSLDPDVDYDSGITYIRNVYDTLVSAVGARQVQIVPNLAASWQVSSDGKTWTFHLRPHVTFHDGSPVD